MCDTMPVRDAGNGCRALGLEFWCSSDYVDMNVVRGRQLYSYWMTVEVSVWGKNSHNHDENFPARRDAKRLNHLENKPDSHRPPLHPLLSRRRI